MMVGCGPVSKSGTLDWIIWLKGASFVHSQRVATCSAALGDCRCLLGRKNHPMSTTRFHNLSVLPTVSYMHIQCMGPMFINFGPLISKIQSSLSVILLKAFVSGIVLHVPRSLGSFPIRALGIVPSFFSYISHILHIGPYTKVSFNLHWQSILQWLRPCYHVHLPEDFFQVQCVCVYIFFSYYSHQHSTKEKQNC